jgi:hypothetical protein
LVVGEMEIVSRCIDKELNALAMDSQRMTKANILLQCSTLNPLQKNAIALG